MLVSDLHSWPDWTPWSTETDPSLTWDFRGADRGVGAVWAWSGDELGSGKLEITRSDPDGVDYKLASEGFVATGTIRYETIDDGNTRVTWTDSGTLDGGPLVKWWGTLQIDAAIGGQLEAALGALKERVEKPPGQQADSPPSE